jgi:DNA-binding PadR family transcriptional regulator
MSNKNNNGLVKKVIKNFSDIVILKYLIKNPQSNGYQILRHLKEEFAISFSPGTVYHVIYGLEREKLIESQAINEEKSRTYRITEKGQKALESTYTVSDTITNLVAYIVSEKKQELI